ncbi:LAQU0S06e04786g1_1 [Lachancea quebecensis]|uniref:LAQU0S06e04786g1_1 n=1 Tax=Lachancea quebecensis TaxID=1654605 RepID=A0A0P1KS36_9SACH|nr:LAQU0S06e04786g1_1 [Lachancea quebecensis]
MQALPMALPLQRIDSSVYDFQTLSDGNYLPLDTASFSSGMEHDDDPEYEREHEREHEREQDREHEQVYAQASATQMASSGFSGFSGPGPEHDHVRHRTQFTRAHDALLLHVVLMNGHRLACDVKSKSRRLFWHHVSTEMATSFGVHKNKRQCRDRFKLLFQRATSQNQFDGEAACAPPTTELDRLLRTCFHTFRFTEAKEIALAHVTSTQHLHVPPTAPATAPATVSPLPSSGMATMINTPASQPELCEKSTPATTAAPAAAPVPVPVPAHGSAAWVPSPSWETQTVLASISSLQRQINQLSSQIDALSNMVSFSRMQPRLYQPMYTGPVNDSM